MNTFDLIVIGGGINGVGIAREGSLQGYRILLLEQDDICSGVSAWSGRLAHGGLRYLEHYDFALVRESLLERERLIKNAPHLAKPVPWIMPVYKHNKRGRLLVQLGMTLFDVLSFDKTSPTHRFWNREKTIARVPGIGTHGLKGAFHYWDGQIELAERLCIENCLDALQNGAEIKTHTRVESPIMEGETVVGVTYRDTITGEESSAYAPVIYNVAGPWIDRIFTEKAEIQKQPRLNGGTKGSHLIVNPFPGAPKEVVYYETREDGRLILLVPWLGKYLIGTTDIRWEEDPNDARCDIGELEYLINEVNALIPEADLKASDVLYTYSGVRPLPYEPEKNESAVTRTHVLFDHSKYGIKGFVTVVGGKLVTARKLSEDAVVDLNKRFGRKGDKTVTRRRRLPGGDFKSLDGLIKELSTLGASELVASRLANIYGSRSKDIYTLVQSNPAFENVIDSRIGLTRAEVEFVIDHEFPRTLTDLMARRLVLAFEEGHGLDYVEEIAVIAAEKLGWNSLDIEHQITDYKKWLDHLAIPDETGPRSSNFGAKRLSESR